MKKTLPILHVDGSLTEYVDKRGVLHRIAGVGGYLVISGKIVDKFFKTMKDVPHTNHHEEYAIIEGLKWLKEKNISSVTIKTDSVPSVKLFTHKKKTVTKIDKFFLLQYLMLEYSFEFIDLCYHSRSEDDLSHHLSRTYITDIPKDVIKLHNEHNKKMKDYDIRADAGYHCEKDITKILYGHMKDIQLALK